ncbi:hypothetical protein [Pedobacter ginsengisoli]|uniref:hypothetical protein n=1 Tax=Pedobacter ginsengisoli TaxID=363852 RepID=UPI002549EB6C|nr:hypothetical protein [Pedobacter ginsengisoli]
MKPQIALILILCLSSFQTAFSQIKKIEGDTTYWFKGDKSFQKQLDLKDFEKSKDEFNFRFRNHGQVIEITKDSSGLNGTITNYIYHTKKTTEYDQDTLYNKIILSLEQARNVYRIVQSTGILELPSDNEIKKWRHGLDGITYFIEHADQQVYWAKHYWTPSSQDSIPEAITVRNFLKELSDTLNLEEIYTTFRNDLPKHGCYSSGGTGVTCYASNSLELGYSGATKLPLGFYGSYSASYIGKAAVNSGIALQYNFDNSGFYHLNFQASKWNIFFKKASFYDFIAYNYQNRKLDIHHATHQFENHQIKYGLNLSNFGFGAGLDYLKHDDEKMGGHIYASKWFSKTKISTVLISSIFDNQINYKLDLRKSFYLNQRSLISQFSLGLAYECFFGYRDLYFGLYFSL